MLPVHRSHFENHCSTIFQTSQSLQVSYLPTMLPLLLILRRETDPFSEKMRLSKSNFSYFHFLLFLTSPLPCLFQFSLIFFHLSLSSTFVKICCLRSIFPHVDSITHTPLGPHVTACQMNLTYTQLKHNLFVYSHAPSHLFSGGVSPLHHHHYKNPNSSMNFLVTSRQ